MTTSARSGRSNTWRFSTPVADFGPRDEPQRPQTHAVCSITQSGSATCRNVAPLWPFCPPLGRPDAPRRLPGTRGFAFNPSLEGGRELFELSCPNCRRRSATSASSAAIWRFSEAINSSTSTGRTMPPVDSDSPPAVSKDQPNKPLFKSPVTFPTHPGLGVTKKIGASSQFVREMSQAVLCSPSQAAVPFSIAFPRVPIFRPIEKVYPLVLNYARFFSRRWPAA